MLLQQQCREAKHKLGSIDRVAVQIPVNGRTEKVMVRDRDFLSLTADLLQRTRDTTELVLDECRIRPTDLDEVVLVGGSTRMPAVRNMLKDLTGREPVTRLDPQRAVAQGAAVHAAILLATERSVRSTATRWRNRMS